jgi:hypothetical protein
MMMIAAVSNELSFLEQLFYLLGLYTKQDINERIK